MLSRGRLSVEPVWTADSQHCPQRRGNRGLLPDRNPVRGQALSTGVRKEVRCRPEVGFLNIFGRYSLTLSRCLVILTNVLLKARCRGPQK